MGTAIAGPGAGAALGSIVANVFGVKNTPDAIAKAIESNPEAAVKLRQIESDERVRLREIAMQAAVAETDAETARMRQVNETMRAELRAPLDIRSAWRPIFGLVSAIGYGMLLFSVVGAVIGTVLMAFGVWGADPANVSVLAKGVGAMV
ncbi:MAG: 3TM-type holin, partial [Salinisphaera sp.]|nr:3TM-type holin [Salinisphaera sp.]